MPSLSLDLLEEVVAILPLSQEDLLYKGIATAITERIVELKRANQQFVKRYGSRRELERRIEIEGVPPDDHTLYGDLLEWRAIGHELSQLMRLLRALPFPAADR
jgi:hypothetical protein